MRLLPDRYRITMPAADEVADAVLSGKACSSAIFEPDSKAYTNLRSYVSLCSTVSPQVSLPTGYPASPHSTDLKTLLNAG